MLCEVLISIMVIKYVFQENKASPRKIESPTFCMLGSSLQILKLLPYLTLRYHIYRTSMLHYSHQNANYILLDMILHRSYKRESSIVSTPYDRDIQSTALLRHYSHRHC